MNTRKLFYVTLIVSLIVQIMTGVIEVGTVFINVPPSYNLIRELFILDLIVQFIEFGFYFWLAFNVSKILNVTPKRYIDWVITTPSMLVTLILYLIYLNKKPSDDLDGFTLLKSNSGVIIPVLILNWTMLLFGYLGEINVLPVLPSILLGFIPFLIYYYMIYINYVVENNDGYLLFWYFFWFWSLYGIAALFPYYIKNSFYNILDLFAKNFFGVFLSYIIIYGKY